MLSLSALNPVAQDIIRIAGARTHFVSYGRWRPIRLSDSIPIRRIPPVNGNTGDIRRIKGGGK